MEKIADANEDTLNTTEEHQCVTEDTVANLEKDKYINECPIATLEKDTEIDEGTIATLEKDTDVNEGTIATLEKDTDINEGKTQSRRHLLGRRDVSATGNFYDKLLKPHERVRITNLLNKYVKADGECLIWTKQTNRHGYGIITFVIDKTRIKCTVHRLSYFLHHEKNLQPTRHVSHLCFNRVCVKVDHLSYEPQSINNGRKRCKLEGYCAGHYGYRKCLVELVR